MQKTYYIYHIKGRKIGCSYSPHDRAQSQLKKGEVYEIIYQTEDIKIVSLVEQTLQMMYDYPVDVAPYYKSVRFGSKTPEHNLKNSKANKIAQNTPQALQRASRIGKANKGKKHTQAFKDGCSARTKGSNNPNYGPQAKITCPWCNLTGGKANMKRWHFDNCKDVDVLR